MLFQKGIVKIIDQNYIIFESNNTGYIIYVPNKNKFEKYKNKEIKIYIHIYRNEFTKTYYGFKTIKERNLFINLLTIDGIGTKNAMLLIRNGANKLIKAIIESDINFIKKTPYIGEQTAAMIIFELKNKYT